MAELTSGVAGLDNYVKLFSDNRPLRDTSKVRVSSDYYSKVIDDESVYSSFAALNGDEDIIDTSLEWVLATYYSPALVSIRPPEAAKLLPANSKESALKLALATYKELTEIKFLTPNDTAAVGRYEGMLKFVSDKSGVTRAEIENYYRNGIRGLIAEVVDEQFNRISFMIDKDASRSYNAVLTRNAQTGHYTLSYESFFGTNTMSTKELSAPSLEALLATMQKNTSDFNQACINTVRDKAALIPAVVYADWKTRGVANGVDALALVKEALVNFYTSPSRSTYEPLVGICARYYFNGGTIWGTFTEIATTAYLKTLSALAPALVGKIDNDVRKDERGALARTPNDSRYNVFSTRR